MKSTLKILVVSYSFPPEWAGPAERFLRYVPGLKDRGIEFEFVTRLINEDQPKSEVYRNARVNRLKVKEDKWSFERFLFKASRFALNNSFSAVVFLSYSYINTPISLLLRMKGTPTIGLHTMALDLKVSSFKSFIIKTLEQISLFGNSYMISSTQFLKQNIAKLGFPLSKIEVIANGVNLQRFQPVTESEKERIRKRLNIPEGFNVLFVGLKTPRKGVLELVKAWKIYKDQFNGTGHLILVGPDRREQSHLVDFYSEWDLETKDATKYNIELRGSTNEVEAYFQVCNLFAFLSNLEGLPNVLPEAMACGIPILMNPYEGYSEEVARGGEHVMLTSREPVEIANALHKLINNKAEIERLGVAGKNWVSQTQDVEVTLDKYASFFRFKTGQD